MTDTTTHQGNRHALVDVIRAVDVAEAGSFLAGAALHAGLRLPLGVTTVREPRIIPATVVEGLAGIGLGVSAYALFTHRRWAWPAAVAAHAFSLAGVLLGMGALAAGRGPTTELNTYYHRTILEVLVANLALLLTPSAKAALGSAGR